MYCRCTADESMHASLARDGSRGSVFWDTNLFIYLFEQNPTFGEQVRQLRLRMRCSAAISLATSALTIGEILVKTSSGCETMPSDETVSRHVFQPENPMC